MNDAAGPAARKPSAVPADDGAVAQFRERVREFRKDPGSLIEALYLAQETFGYITPRAIEVVSEELGYPEAHVYGVVTFYTLFYTEPQPKYILRVCRDLSCDIAGAKGVARRISEELHAHAGEATGDGLFKLELVSCLGQCERQPAMLVNLEAHGPMDSEGAAKLIQQLRERK